MNNRAAWLVALFSLALLGGCGKQDLPTADVEPQDRVEQDPVVVTVVDRTGYDAVLVSLRGKVVLVDCWASWCLPCMQQLPHTFELAKRHSNLAVVTLAFDDPDNKEQLTTLLSSHGAQAATHNLVSAAGSSTTSMEDFEISAGALPHYKVYDSTGKLRHTFEIDPSAETQFTTADIDAAVDELLDEATAN